MGPPRKEQLQPHLDASSHDVDGNEYQSSAVPPLHNPSLSYEYGQSSPHPTLPYNSADHAGIPNKHSHSPHPSSAPSYPSNESPVNPNATPPTLPVTEPPTKIATRYSVQAGYSHQPELPQWPQPLPSVHHEPNPEAPIVNPQPGYSHQPELPQWPQQPPPVRPQPNPEPELPQWPQPPPPVRPEHNAEPPFVNLQPVNYHQPQPHPSAFPQQISQQPIVMPQMGVWTTGLLSCHEDATNCLVTAFCPCITFGQIAEIVDQGHTSCGTGALTYSAILCCCGVPCIYSCSYRTKLRAKFNLDGTPFIDTLLHCVFESCALCQEYRELANRGMDPAIGWVGNLERYQQQQQAAMAPPSSQAMYK